MDGGGEEHSVVAPAYLAKLRLELGVAGHVVRGIPLIPNGGGCSNTPADFTLEEMRRLLIIF